ncbi:hypothetical protein M501DRAFT_1022452 [Patellaria atrata CBS 101060]|uniref:Glutathione transferase n=1 Tax=Patellaria atrata CBS 101060 TaxID=1346257 RepID=A0A9P4VR15_9PEZI|nr:hypothetical protein M501DRAFT_1022452 [Patellaria atrata CBS 101060]
MSAAHHRPLQPAVQRILQPAILHGLAHPQGSALLQHDLNSLPPELPSFGLANINSYPQRYTQAVQPLQGGTQAHPLHPDITYGFSHGVAQSLPIQPHSVAQAFNNQQLNTTTTQFSLAPQQNAVPEPRQESPIFSITDQTEVADQTEDTLHGFLHIKDPPDLDVWRERLFNINETIVMTEEQFLTYFPHVDNVYSHRSTQRYKRKPFKSYYWDCRLKGRPPGTKKSDDPTKKKRKRVARELNLCDVKIKITEYQPGALPPELFVQASGPDQCVAQQTQTFYSQASVETFTSGGSLWPINTIASPPNTMGANPIYSGKYYTIQRVNGNNGNGKNDGVSGGHKHTLQDSDRIKKNSVIRFAVKDEKEKKQAEKTYHKKATGTALNTVKRHSAEEDLKLYGSCFCPFVQRVWISLEAKGIPYQYIEVDPYKKPQSLLDVNPRGLVPALRHGDWGCYESTVLMEYLEDLNVGQSLLPSDAKGRAYSRLWSDHINRHVIPSFYRYLQEQDVNKQMDLAGELKTEISKLLDAAVGGGPFFLGSDVSFVDVQIAPWIIRLNRVLKPYRGWPDPEPDTRWAKWVEAIEKNEHVQATTSTDDLYLDSYERYAENRPDTSQLAKAVNSGRGLP